MTTIVGISAYYHDSAACIIENGAIIAAAHEERFTRKKHDASFPRNALKFCLDYAGRSLKEVSAVVFYDKPLLTFERLLETYHAFVPKGFTSFLVAIPVWIREKLFLKRLLKEELKKVEDVALPRILFSEHHLSHAASAFYPSPFEKAAILTIDGVGEWATTTIALGEGKDVEILSEIHFPHSLGLLYSAFTYYCGFKVNSGEYKLMGLAPYGHRGERTNRFIEIIRNELLDIRDDGSFLLNMKYFDFATGLRMCNDPLWQDLFGIPRREPETDIDQPYMDMALAIQTVTEDVVLRLAQTAKEMTGADNLVMAGGVALNCVANGKLLRADIFDQIWIQPAAGDAGGALGAALAAYNMYFDNKLDQGPFMDKMSGSYLGPEFGRPDIMKVVRRYSAKCHELTDKELFNATAKLLSQGKIVGWFQGRMEWGPRALGNRSILADPRMPEMQKRLNLKIKFREGFRPFAPSVLAEDAKDIFELECPSPYMLLVANVRKEHRLSVPDDYFEMDMMDRLYVQRSNFPAITHVDFSARIQTVHKETNPRYWQLIKAFKDLTGCPLLVNTSFNVRGEPIVATPEDAYRCFMRTDMDILVMENFIFFKDEQKKWDEEIDWQKEFELD